MERLHQVSYLDLSHFLAGCLLLLAIWGALYVTKGTKAHKSAGRVFLVLFVYVAITSLPRVYDVFQKGDISRAWAFGLLALISVTLALQGAMAIRLKGKPDKYYGSFVRLTLAYLLGIGGIPAVCTVFVGAHSWLLVIFGSLATMLWARMIFQRGNEDYQMDGLWWKREHMYSMLSLAAGAHVGLVLIIGFVIDHKMSDALLAILSLPLVAAAIGVIMVARKRHLIQA